jgi:hypothetical protein
VQIAFSEDGGGQLPITQSAATAALASNTNQSGACQITESRVGQVGCRCGADLAGGANVMIEPESLLESSGAHEIEL